MTKRIKLLLLAAMIAFGIGSALWPRKKNQPVDVPTVNAPAQPPYAAPALPQPQPVAAPGPVAEPARKFASMGVMERNAQLMEIKQQDLATIFRRWRDASRVDQDMMKQGAIATTLAYTMRERTPSPELVEEMRQYVADGSNSLRERAGVIGVFGGAKTREAVDFLLQVATTIEDKELRQVALAQITGVGALWGDGSYHEERSPALEEAWHESRDPDLLIAAAVAIAKIGAPSAIESLLSAALRDDGRDDVRKRAALGALDKVYTRNAVPPVAALLATLTASTPASTLAGDILVGIGDPSAAKALLGWLQNADASATIPVRDFVARTHTPSLLEAWSTALDSKVAFRSEQIRETIRAALIEYHQNHNSGSLK
ncbi:MAG: HEAT repeat domain-containing protein [Opitutaceae bacterium]